MNRMNILILAVGIVFGPLSTMAVSGCSKAADRTVTIRQLQHRGLHDSQFRIVTSELAEDAIKERTDSGPSGAPKTMIELSMHHEYEIVIRPRSN